MSNCVPIPSSFSKPLPLLSISASGQVAQQYIFWVSNGRQFVRNYVHPAHTCSPAQCRNRKRFAFAVSTWQSLSNSEKQRWHVIGADKRPPVTSLNAFITDFIKTSTLNFTCSPSELSLCQTPPGDR